MKFVGFVLLTLFSEEIRCKVYSDCAGMADQLAPAPQKYNLTQHKNWNLLPHGRCGLRNLDTSSAIQARISGGKDVDKYEMSWVANVNVYADEQPLKHCSGSLINERYVLTAAQCCGSAKDFVNNTTWFLGGFHHYAISELKVASEEFHIHERYNACQSNVVAKHDICLVRLAEEIKFKPRVYPICLPIEDIIKPGDKVQIAGFGRPSRNTTGSEGILQQKTVTVISQDDCRKTMQAVDAREICTTGGQCVGDSGGPLVEVAPKDQEGKEIFYLYGIISYGEDNCTSDGVTVSTRVTEYIDWILDHMKA